MALICGFAAVFGTAAPAGAATTESFALTSAAVPGQSSIGWQVGLGSPPATPNAFPDQSNPLTLAGQIDPSTGAISGASLTFPPIPQPPNTGENPTFTIGEVHPGTATGTFDSTTGAVTLHDALTITLTVEPINFICTSEPVNVALSGTWDSATQDVTLATTSSFTIPQFPSVSPCAAPAAQGLNASPGGTAGSVGNSLTVALNGNFAPGLPTTTSLSATPDSPQSAGAAVVLTASVTDPSSAGTPTGNVNFMDNGISLGTEALDGTGTATLKTSSLPQVPNQQITAIYAGTSIYATSTSQAVSYTIQPLPTISINGLPPQITGGESSFPTPTPFTMTVSNPQGGTTYTNNLFLYISVQPGSPLYQPDDVELSYQDQSGNWCPLPQSKAVAYDVNYGVYGKGAIFFGGFGAAPCGFAPAFSLQPGGSFTLNMRIAFSYNSGTGFTGGVLVGASLLTGSCTSDTSCTIEPPINDTKQANVWTQAQTDLVTSAGPSLSTATITPQAPTVVRSGYGIPLTARVDSPSDSSPSPGTAPTGTAQFFIDGQLVGTSDVLASGGHGHSVAGIPGPYYPSPPLAPGTHTYTVNYSGDPNFAPNSASVTFTVTAGPPAGTPYVCAATAYTGANLQNYDAYVSATGLGVPESAASGTEVDVSDVSVTLNVDIMADLHGFPTENSTIGVTPGTGTVDADSIELASSPADAPTDDIGTWSGLSATVQVTGNPGDDVPVGIGSISFTYSFSGTVNCTPVDQPAAIGTVAITGTTLDVSPASSAPAGTLVTMTATVYPILPPLLGGTAPPGQVDFYDGTTYLGTAAPPKPTQEPTSPISETTSLTLNNLSTGDHQLSAIWSGYGGVPPSTSNTVDYQVGTGTTTTVASSANPANAANPVTFTATVTPPLGALTQPTGDVSFTTDGNPIASCQDVALSMDSPPTATCATSFGAGESHAIVATYSGDDTYLGSSADPLTQTTLPGTNTTILSTKDPSPPGKVTFWAGVSPSAGTGDTPTGTVAFTIDGTIYKPCNAAPLGPGGGASCTVSFRAGTSHRVSATYPGSATYSGSSSSTITQTVTSGTGTTGPKDTGGSATLAPGKSLTAGQQLSAASYRLVMQRDGNLVEYQGPKALWASHTAGHPGTGVVMQKDGNLVEYFHGHAIWASNTWGHPGAHLTLQGADGNVVIYQGATALWSTRT